MNKKIIYCCIAIALVFIIAACVVVIVTNKNNNEKAPSNANNNSSNATVQPTQGNFSDEAITFTEEQVKSLFNSKFDYIKGDYVTGAQVIQLLSLINYSNEHDPENQVKVTINGTSSTDLSLVKKSNTYKVTHNYNSNGLIENIVIEEN